MQKFNVQFSEEAYEEMGVMSGLLGVSMADIVRDAVSLFAWLADEKAQGHRLVVERPDGRTEVVVPSLERANRRRRHRPAVVQTPPPTGQPGQGGGLPVGFPGPAGGRDWGG